MLKRLLVAALLAASALVISGGIGIQPAGATDSPCVAADRTAGVSGTAAAKCRWREKYGNWCKYCYKFGEWRLQYCKDID